MLHPPGPSADPPLESSPFGYFKRAMREKFSTFSGRARRAEFWWTMAIASVIFWVVSLVALVGLYVAALGDGDAVGPIFVIATMVYVVLWIVFAIPLLACTVRRLHDTDKSGWWCLISFIPVVQFALLVLLATEGDRHANRYGLATK